MLMHGLLLAATERHPDKIAFHWVDRGRSLTYAQAADQMACMAGALHSLGVGRGDRVTIFAHNGLDYLIGMLGSWCVGAIAALVNVKFADALDYYFADHEPKAVIYTHDTHAVVRKAAAKVRSVQHLICMDGPEEGAHSLPELLAARLSPPVDPGDESAIAHLSYTSGTSGTPKGACLMHEPTIRAARCIAERLRITCEDISFGPTALSSSYQLVGNLLPPLAHGCSINVMGKWTQASGWEALEAADASILVANPTLLTDLVIESHSRGRTPRRLRLGLSGGGPVPPTLKRAWRDELKLPLVESYGQSELGGFVALGYPVLEPDDARMPRIGPPLPDKEVRIIGPDERPLRIGEIGEMVLRGGYMWGYWNKPDKTKETLRGGWLHTGDAGLLDRDGFITMRGRYSELIEVRGRQWFPRDVEEALCREPGVRQAALIGVPDPSLGQRPVAFVTLDRPDVSPDGLKRSIVGVVEYDLASLEVRVLSELPMTPTGKISKGQLLDLVASGAI
jgi:acyl-CoA synthetase (AMP-forming)/AMP-acid ligase II